MLIFFWKICMLICTGCTKYAGYWQKKTKAHIFNLQDFATFAKARLILQLST